MIAHKQIKKCCVIYLFHSFYLLTYLFIYFSLFSRLQNSPYFCVFKYARAVKQKVWNGAENRERLPISLLILRKKPTVLQSTYFLFFICLKTSNCVTELSRFAMLPALLVTSFFAAIFTAGYWK